MKNYNRALDFVALAFAEHREGRVLTAAQLFAEAVACPDVERAIKVIEASNNQAFAASQAVKAQARAQEEAKSRAEAAAALEERRKALASILGDRLPVAEFAATEPEEAEDEAIEKEEKEVEAAVFANALRAAVKK